MNHFTVPESDKYKAVILRIDSPGGDALASDL
jgi:protease IV